MNWIEIEHFIDMLIHNPYIIVLGTVTLIQIAPIRIDPWTSLFRWMGRIINGEIQKDLTELKTDFENTKANDMRWNILNFANSCRRGEEHSKDEWRHVMSQILEYEDYTEKKDINNGVIEEDARYLRELYMDRNKKNDFL